MRNFIVLLFAVVGLALVGCSPSGSSSSAGDNPDAAPTPPPTAVTGTVSLQPGSNHQVPENASLELTVMDVSRQPNLAIASKTIAPVGSMPVSFKLPFDRDGLIATDIYIVRALITADERRFTTPLEYPVLTQGAPANINVVVIPEPTPGEEMLVAYRKVKNTIGGMDISQGTSLGDNSSRAWQIFRSKDDGKIKYVKEIVDYFESGSRVTTDYAYKDGVPWVVVQHQMPSAGAQADVVDRAGWNDAGELVVMQHVSGGETSELSTTEAQSLREQAEAMLKRAQEK